MNTKNIIIAAILACMIMVSPAYSQSVGEPALDFEYVDADGRSYSLSDYRGKVLFVYLFGSYCSMCKNSGYLTEEKVEDNYGRESDFQALGMDVWDGSENQVRGFEEFTGITYPLLMDAKDMATGYSLIRDRLLVIDRQGILRHKGSTSVSNGINEATAVIDELLATTGTGDIVSGETGLDAIYPNPASTYANIQFSISREENVRIGLLNALGQEVMILSPEYMPSGTHTREINTAGLQPGIYLVRMDIQEGTYFRKLLVRR